MFADWDDRFRRVSLALKEATVTYPGFFSSTLDSTLFWLARACIYADVASYTQAYVAMTIARRTFLTVSPTNFDCDELAVFDRLMEDLKEAS